MPLDVNKVLKGPMKFKMYLYLTAGHLFPIELFFGWFVQTYPQYERSAVFIDFAYVVIVILHGIHWGFKRMGFVPKMMFFFKPYFDEVERLIRHCPNCQVIVGVHATECLRCHAQLPPPDREYIEFGPHDMVAMLRAVKEFTSSQNTKYCPACKTAMPIDRDACPHCGLEFNKKTTGTVSVDDIVNGRIEDEFPPCSG